MAPSEAAEGDGNIRDSFPLELWQHICTMRVGKRAPGKLGAPTNYVNSKMWTNVQQSMYCIASDGARDEIGAAQQLKHRGVFPHVRYGFRDDSHTGDSASRFWRARIPIFNLDQASRWGVLTLGIPNVPPRSPASCIH